jgi:hypothetical protein
MNRQKANAATTSPQRAKKVAAAVAKPRLSIKKAAIAGDLFLLPAGVGSLPIMRFGHATPIMPSAANMAAYPSAMM